MVRCPCPFDGREWYLGEQGSCVTDIPFIYVGWKNSWSFRLGFEFSTSRYGSTEEATYAYEATVRKKGMNLSLLIPGLLNLAFGKDAFTGLIFPEPEKRAFFLLLSICFLLRYCRQFSLRLSFLFIGSAILGGGVLFWPSDVDWKLGSCL